MGTQTARTLTAEEYAALKAQYDHYHAERARQYPRKNGITVEEQATLPAPVSNEDISAMEVYEFKANPPDSYTLYVEETGHFVTTWMGDVLGIIRDYGRVFRSNFGDKRQYLTIAAINGRTYGGFFCTGVTTGTCMNVKALKSRK